MGDESLDRRTFLKGAAAIGTSIAAATVAAAGTPGAAREALRRRRQAQLRDDELRLVPDRVLLQHAGLPRGAA